MPDDTHVDTNARKRRTIEHDTFRPAHTDDRLKRRVRDDHAPNAALHSTLSAMVEDDDTTSVNLMASHGPGETDHNPRYYVAVTLENHGAGEPSTGPTILDDLVRTDDVKITKAYGGARYDDVTVHDDTGSGNDPSVEDVADAVGATVDQAVDYLTVHVRPVQTRVEPVEVRVDDIPDRFVEVDDTDDMEEIDEVLRRMNDYFDEQIAADNQDEAGASNE